MADTHLVKCTKLTSTTALIYIMSLLMWCPEKDKTSTLLCSCQKCRFKFLRLCDKLPWTPGLAALRALSSQVCCQFQAQGGWVLCSSSYEAQPGCAPLWRLSEVSAPELLQVVGGTSSLWSWLGLLFLPALSQGPLPAARLLPQEFKPHMKTIAI